MPTGPSVPSSPSTVGSSRCRSGCTFVANTPANRPKPCVIGARPWTRGAANRLRHPAVRLYGEYLWAYISMINHAPLSPADKRECFRHLAHWMAARALPVARRGLRREPLQEDPLSEMPPDSCGGCCSRAPAPEGERVSQCGSQRLPRWKPAVGASRILPWDLGRGGAFREGRACPHDCGARCSSPLTLTATIGASSVVPSTSMSCVPRESTPIASPRTAFRGPREVW